MAPTPYYWIVKIKPTELKPLASFNIDELVDMDEYKYDILII